MTALKASQIHNERLTDRHSNPDIDIDRSDQNVVFFKTGNLLENVRERVADIQAGQKRKIRRDAPVAIEYMITASPEAMARLSKQEQEQYFAESLNFVEARHGTRNRLSAVLHLDETTPHLHVLVFPEREGKLDAKSFFKLPALTAMQDEFAVKVGRQFGLERGVRLTELLEKGEKPHRHQSVAVYKAKKLKETEQALSRLEQTTEDLAAIEAIQPQKNLFSSRVSVTQDEFETLSSQAKAYAATKEILQKRSKTLLERDLNCKVEVTVDLDDDAPKREYVPLTRLKKQTEAEAKKLESLKKQSEELQGEIDSLKELKKSQDQQCRELTDRECRIRDQNAKLESRRVELIQEINQLAPKTVSYWKSFHDYTKQWFEKIQRPKVFEKIFNDFHLSYFKSITEPKMKQRSEPER